MKKIGDYIDGMTEEQLSLWFPRTYRNRLDYTLDDVISNMEKIGVRINPRFTLDKFNMFTYRNIALWLIGDPAMQAMDPENTSVIPADVCRGIYIGGGVGTGKSTAINIARLFSYILNSSITIKDKNVPLKLKPEHASSICSEYSTTGDIDKYISENVLVVQDLGNEPSETLYMGNRVPVMKTIIEMRYDLNKITCFTSNLNPCKEDFARKYGARAASRITEMCNYLYLGGQDRRRKP